MQVYPNRFANELKQGLKPCYLIFGDEPQQKFEIIQQLREQARNAGFTERTVLVADKDFNWGALIEATQTLSLFASQQLIELELPSGKPGTEGSKILQEVAPMLGPDTLLIVHGPRIGKDVQKAKWFKVLDDIGVHSLCYPLEGKSLHGWLQQKVAEAGLNLTPPGIKFIADYCEGNLMAAKQEIDKLSLLFENRAISEKDLEQAMVDQSRFNVFQLVDVMLSGEQQRCVKMLYRLESEGIEPNILIWALVREWQTLWSLQVVRQSGQPVQWQKFGIWRNRQAAYESALSRLPLAKLKRLQQHLQAADLAFKQSVIERPYIKLCHLCMLFMGIPLDHFPVLETEQ
ncbi:DNA polymerase III subunit delta [Alteromonas aestuariivivens]|uniref:DNA polymerase III subunit delta n=1 Tax=Alteromonas aestuariivivens TaxID=1938339 RepID=A0A3D8M8R1_9ALTE|nr:DNA polymerase III subunit delta [Alteromonas aestuariivivens]RDV26122.1 DNA polymerase III subunit delta [Alteromonas aestuariivivens]